MRQGGAPGHLPRVVALRASFDQTVVDPEFRADAVKVGADLSPQPGRAVEDLIRRLYATPHGAVDALSAALPPVASR